MGFIILIVLFQHKKLLFLNHLRYLRSYKFDEHTVLISYTTHPNYNELIDLHLYNGAFSQFLYDLTCLIWFFLLLCLPTQLRVEPQNVVIKF